MLRLDSAWVPEMQQKNEAREREHTVVTVVWHRTSYNLSCIWMNVRIPRKSSSIIYKWDLLFQSSRLLTWWAQLWIHHDPKSFTCHSLISLITCKYLVNWCTILVHIHPEMAKLLVQKWPINDRTHQIIDLVSVLWFVYYFNDLNLQTKGLHM